MDRLEEIAAVAGGVVDRAAEAAGAAKVDELDDAGGHQHDVVALQVPVDHPVQVQVGHALQDLAGVKGQDALRQRTESEEQKDVCVFVK